ncbi:beta-1,3-galactosyltransferase 2-like [Nerophis ophidion]|uniref:beta-1,3-galactosyltransferase 2-like n=1 Tax=Nerophis ophidion TaxID=159077 RepID=UPI002ADF3D65|nr:beta-1,3-galactosyltransferase 2-like [Nerophis ophidion]XP_061752848.1 beta-1,3-galactosyltransferase 2-like [Nerophis ophidion]XP_061752849.1 beta-1,3-galactosyltransferase 2-like [Nerophis ophidion]
MKLKRRQCFSNIAKCAFLLALLAVLVLLVARMWHPSLTAPFGLRGSPGTCRDEGDHANQSSVEEVEEATNSHGKKNDTITGVTGLQEPGPVKTTQMKGRDFNATLVHGLFPYIINEPAKCQGGRATPFLVFIITTVASEVEARSAIRQTWANQTLVPGVAVLRLFLLGKLGGELGGSQQRMLQEESAEHHDIIQQDFVESYNNMTLKTLMGLHWVARYCPHAGYVMKTDSDMFINTEYLIHKLLRPELKPKTNYYTGRIIEHELAHRDKKNRWYMSEEEYGKAEYPAFCSGTGYVLSADLADKILRVSLATHIVHLEDVHVGLCLSQLGVKPTKTSIWLFNHYHVPFTRCMYSNLITSHQITPKELLQYWTRQQKNKNICQRMGLGNL